MREMSNEPLGMKNEELIIENYMQMPENRPEGSSLLCVSILKKPPLVSSQRC